MGIQVANLGFLQVATCTILSPVPAPSAGGATLLCGHGIFRLGTSVFVFLGISAEC